MLDSLATEAQLNRVCDYVGKEADAIDVPVAADSEEVEEDAEATADLAVGKDEVANVIANNILCHEITAAIDVEEDFIEVNPDDDPDDEDGGEGEGVPVAKVVYYVLSTTFNESSSRISPHTVC